jgi:hypothetical protein
MKVRASLIFALFVAALLWAAPAGWAQDQAPVPVPGAAQSSEQPNSRVARISVIQGNVSTQRGDTGEWTAATVNTPVVPGDRVSTGDHSRAEIQLDYANVIRLGEGTVVRIADLEPQRIQIEVGQGLVSFDSFQNSDSDVEADTPNLAIHPRRDGLYRIQVISDGETQVAVRRGQAELGTAEGSTTLELGQLITVRGDSNSAQYKVDAAPGRDGFDQWNEERDQIIQGSLSSPNLSPYYTGGGDLNQNGTWNNVPGYGRVWAPANVPQDWAPYRNGAWVWEPNWGWTWVSYEPWGWAPYHYGRWFVYAGSWMWWPGPVSPYYRPIWAPAYVSFFGFGRGFGVGVGFGSYGWLPIGPADPFFPWWGFGARVGFVGFGEFGRYGGRGFIAPLAGPLRGRAVFSNVNGLENNARLRAGITSVSAGRFGNGRVVPEGGRISAEQIRGAQFAHGSLPVTPGRGSTSASGRPASRGTVPARNLDSQHFFQHNQPGAARSSFAGEPGQSRQATEPQRSSFANAASPATGRESAAGTTRNAESFRQPAARQEAVPQGRSQEPAARAPEPRTNGSANSGGWQRFNSAQGQTGNQAGRGAERSQYRPQLNLHQSIVQQRAPAYGYGRGSYPSAQRPSYTAPRSQPTYRAPEPQRGYGSGPRSAPSAPRGGSGGSRGGGSSHSSGSSHHPGRK